MFVFVVVCKSTVIDVIAAVLGFKDVWCSWSWVVVWMVTYIVTLHVNVCLCGN